MNIKQARTKARRLLGPDALVEEALPGKYDSDYAGRDGYVRKVGVLALGMFFEVRGMGPTWDVVLEAITANNNLPIKDRRGTVYVKGAVQ